MSEFGSSRRAFSLVEVVLALGVTTFCLMALLALLPIGLQSNHDSSSRKLAWNLCSAIEAELRSAAWSSTNSSWTRDLGIVLPPPGGAPQTFTFYDVPGIPGFSTTRDARSQFRFQVTMTPASTEPPRALMRANWPAGDPSTNSANAISLLIALDPQEE